MSSIKNAWDSLHDEDKLAILEALEESKLKAFRMATNLLPYPHSVVIELLGQLSREWGIRIRKSKF